MQAEHLLVSENCRRMVKMDTVAREVRELYLSKFQPQRRPHALSPSVILRRLNPTLVEKSAARSGRTSDDGWRDVEEEDWLDDNEGDGVVSEDDSWIQDPLPPLPKDDNSSSDQVDKKRSTNNVVRRSRRKKGRSEVVTVDMVPIKQEEPDEVDISSTAATTTVPMTILPADAYPHIPLYSNTLISQSPEPLDLVETDMGEATVKEETSENVIVMPFDVEEDSKTVDPSNVVSLNSSEVVSSTAGMPATRKSLKDLSKYLEELNEKNLQFLEHMKKLHEEYEQRLAATEAEKKQNEKEINRVLLLIQSLKDPGGPEGNQSSPHSTPASPALTTAERGESQRLQPAASQNSSGSSSSTSSSSKAGTGTKKSKKTTTRSYDKKPLMVKYWAVRAVETGQPKAQVMSKYGVPASTLNDWYRHKNSIKQAYEKMM